MRSLKCAPFLSCTAPGVYHDVAPLMMVAVLSSAERTVHRRALERLCAGCESHDGNTSRVRFPNGYPPQSGDHLPYCFFKRGAQDERPLNTLRTCFRFSFASFRQQFSTLIRSGSISWRQALAVVLVHPCFVGSISQLQRCASGPIKMQTVSDLWIVPIFLDF